MSGILVVGPAYLDRVLRVDLPLLDPTLGGPLDRSVEGRLGEKVGSTLILRDPDGGLLTILPPEGWPGPFGTIDLADLLVPDGTPPARTLYGRTWLDDLGGMGAGYAQAFGATLVSAIGSPTDPIARAVVDRLAREGIAHRPVLVPNRPADWTLLLTSGLHGDKLPVGFRGAHASAGDGLVASAVGLAEIEPHLVVAAGLDNRTASSVLDSFPGAIRMFAPSLRSMTARDPSPAALAGRVDILTCNRQEWLAAPEADRIALREGLSLQVETDGPRGALVSFRHGVGHWSEFEIPVFPRRLPPRDTNRAGEAFASTLVATLLDVGWRPGSPIDAAIARRASVRASAASALVLDLERFGFPDPSAIDAAVRAEVVEADPLMPLEPLDLPGEPSRP